jgi:hypothetical protein
MKELYKYKDRVLLYDTETKEVKELDKKTARKVLDSRAKVLDSRVRNSIVKDILEIYDDTLIIVTDEKNKVVYKGIVDYAPKEVRDGRWHKGANNKTFTINSERGVLTVKVLDSSVRDSVGVRDKLVEPDSKSVDLFEREIRNMGFKLESSRKYGKQIHYQVLTIEGDKTERDLKDLAKKLNTLSDTLNRYDIPMTYNIGLQIDGYISAGIDIREKWVEDSISESQALENFKRFLKKHYEYTDEDLKKARVEFEKIDYPFKKSKEVWYGLPDGRVASYCSLDGKKWEDL